MKKKKLIYLLYNVEKDRIWKDKSIFEKKTVFLYAYVKS